MGAATQCGAVNHHTLSALEHCPRPAATNASHITPIGLFIESPNDVGSATSKEDDACGDKKMECLIADMRQQSSRCRHRMVSLIHWRNLFPTFNAAQATELMYFLGRHFRLSTQAEREYCAELPIHSLDDGQFALLKGLGFNQLQLTLPPRNGRTDQNAANRCRDIIESLPQFKFDIFAVGLCYGDQHKTLQDVRRDIDTALTLSPDRIVVREITPGAPNELAAGTCGQFWLLYESLKNAGYSVIGNDWFVRSEDPLLSARRQKRLHHTRAGYNMTNVRQVLHLGAITDTDASESNGAQSTSSTHPTDTPASGFASVFDAAVDQLLCYHELDLRPLYGYGQPDPVDHLLHLQSYSPLYSINGDRLILSKQGILELTDVYQLLYRAFVPTEGFSN